MPLALNIIKCLTMNVIETSFVILVFCGFCFAQDQWGNSTRYWDCCKPSCAWNKKADVSHPVWSCAADGWTPFQDFDTTSGCDFEHNGVAFSCATNQPWVIDDNLSYGFAAVKVVGQNEWTTCCICYEMTFISGPVSGKRMIVQVTNSGSDGKEGYNQFDLHIPGGGVGLYNGCAPQYGAPPEGWGNRYGGVSTREECAQLPSNLQHGCYWRFDWFRNADNPEFLFHRVKCPTAITDVTGCIRADDY